MANRTETCKAAAARLLSELRTLGWTVKADLKVPHATSPDGSVRVWFTPQAMQIATRESATGKMGKARSMWLDRRGLSVALFLQDAARWAA